MPAPVYVLGGARTDFGRNWAAAGAGLAELLAEVAPAALDDAGVLANQVETLHVGNLAGELFAGQAQLGGLLVAAVPELAGRPSMRHEAACASGSMAILAAAAQLQAGYYDVALVVGVELMRNVSAEAAAANLGCAAWAGQEAVDARFPWPALFAEIAEEYDRRYGLDHDDLGAFAEQAYDNAKRNPLAQTRDWTFSAGAFSTDDDVNPLIAEPLRRTDCGRITDGAAAVVLATPAFAQAWARRRGIVLEDVPAIRGFGHRTAPMLLADKLAGSAGQPFLFPHLRDCVADAYRRAGLGGVDDLDVAEVHDCFSITGLVALEHIGLAEPGKAGQAVAEGVIAPGGRLPINPGGGLLGDGHPVGATGVRMLLDAAQQVAGCAGPLQVDGARNALTVNVGGSMTTVAALIVSAGAA